jgi:hypothetical protein
LFVLSITSRLSMVDALYLYSPKFEFTWLDRRLESSTVLACWFCYHWHGAVDFGKPYSLCIALLIGMGVLVVVYKQYPGMYDWLDKLVLTSTALVFLCEYYWKCINLGDYSLINDFWKYFCLVSFSYSCFLSFVSFCALLFIFCCFNKEKVYLSHTISLLPLLKVNGEKDENILNRKEWHSHKILLEESK